MSRYGELVTLVHNLRFRDKLTDVRQHIEMRAKLLELGYLRPPSIWNPGGAVPDEGYQP